MIKSFSAQKAYSLLELTISLAIITLLLTMSTLGLISLRESLNVNSATQGLYDSLQLARSYALNNVTYFDTGDNEPKIPTMYVISMNKTLTNPITLKYCNLVTSGEKIADINTCFVVTNNVFENDIGSISISGNDQGGGVNSCSEVGFLTGTGEIYVKKAGLNTKFISYSNISEDKFGSNCEYLIKSSEGLIDRKVYIEVNANAQTIKKK